MKTKTIFGRKSEKGCIRRCQQEKPDPSVVGLFLFKEEKRFSVFILIGIGHSDIIRASCENVRLENQKSKTKKSKGCSLVLRNWGLTNCVVVVKNSLFLKANLNRA